MIMIYQATYPLTHGMYEYEQRLIDSESNELVPVLQNVYILVVVSLS